MRSSKSRPFAELFKLARSAKLESSLVFPAEARVPREGRCETGEEIRVLCR
jgi:hypothetical protein